MPARATIPAELSFPDERDLARRLVITREELIRLVQAGLVAPPENHHGCWRWNWRQLKALTPLTAIGRVYFIEAGGFIKIGFATNVKQRLRSLQASNPIECRLLYSVGGTRLTEGEFHHRFAHLRHHGEWFRKEDELSAFIAKLKRRAQALPR
jgi:hypothetical protein